MAKSNAELQRERTAALDELAAKFGFATWGRLATYLKQEHERGSKITITVANGKMKKLLTKGAVESPAP